MNQPLFVADFQDRFALAQAWCVLRYERRDNFLSDDDVLDAASLYTVDDGSGVDHDALVDALFTWIEHEAEEG